MNDPMYTLIAVCSLDGMIAYHSRHFTDWASVEDQMHFKEYLANSEIIIAGNNTYKTTKDQLSQRNCIVFTSQVQAPKKINAHCIYMNPNYTNVDQYLREEGYSKITVLGGSLTYTWVLNKKLPGEILMTLEPLIFGKGVSFFTSEDHLFARCTLLSSKVLNKRGTLLLHYKIDHE